MASMFALHQALEEAHEYITGVLDGHMDEAERAKVARWARLLDHRKQEGGGQCPWCGHFGDDCTGSPPTAVDLFREAVELTLQRWDKLGRIEKALGGDLDGLDDIVNEFATTCEKPDTLNEDDIVEALNGLLPADRDKPD